MSVFDDSSEAPEILPPLPNSAAPDSLVNIYATNMAQRDVLLRRADSAKVNVTPEELSQLHKDFAQAVLQSWAAVGIDPKSLADSAKTPADRERLAAA